MKFPSCAIFLAYVKPKEGDTFLRLINIYEDHRDSRIWGYYEFIVDIEGMVPGKIKDVSDGRCLVKYNVNKVSGSVVDKNVPRTAGFFNIIEEKDCFKVSPHKYNYAIEECQLLIKKLEEGYARFIEEELTA